MQGARCEKNLFLALNHPELEEPLSEDTRSVLEAGIFVGEQARTLFPQGRWIQSLDRTTALAETQRALEEGSETLFEAAFEFAGLYARADILRRTPGGWELIEVKATASVKEKHVLDVAFQSYILRGAGLAVQGEQVMYLNGKNETMDLRQILQTRDISAEVAALQPQVSELVTRLKDVAAQTQVPDVKIGPHCKQPGDCSFLPHCWKFLPRQNVFEFPGLGNKVWEYVAQGVLQISDPRFGPFEGVKAQQLRAIRESRRWIDTAGIRNATARWEWPMAFLDFETIEYRIPPFPGLRPFQQIPFQFSVLIQETSGGPFTSYAYLHDDEGDPRAPLAESLLPCLQNVRSIASYYKEFEAARLEELAAHLPGLAPAVRAVVGRLVDPLPVFRAHVYDPAFGASFSIKSVAPAILGSSASYAGMLVPNGRAAQRAYLEAIRSATPAARKAELRQAMLDYCHKDTQVMLELVDWLVAQARELS